VYRPRLAPIILTAILMLLVPRSTGGSVEASGSPAWGPAGVVRGPAGAPTILGTAFTYQGQLKLNGTPVNAACDFRFTAFDAPSGGSQVGAVQTVTNVPVADGLFTAYPVDFGAVAYTNSLWVQVAAACPTGGGFTTFPLQQLTPAPAAVFAESAGTAQSSTGFSGSLAGDVTGTQGATVVASVGGQAAANVASASTLANGATSANTPSTLVARDASGQFAAGTVTTGAVASAAGTALELRPNGERGLRLEPTTGCGAAACAPNVVGGYSGNSVDAGAYGAVIGGGGNSAVSFLDGPNRVTGAYGAVVGGTHNTAGAYGIVLNGQSNSATGSKSIVGGDQSTASGDSAVAFGSGSTASADRAIALVSAAASGVGAIAAGSGAQATNDDSLALGPTSLSQGIASIAIGPSLASGSFSTAIGLQAHATGQFSQAFGFRADTAGHSGAVVISDGSQPFSATCTPTPSTPQSACAQADNEVRVRGAGGIRLRTSVQASDVAGANSNTGCDLPAGSGTWSCSSSRELKTDFSAIDPRAILESLVSLPIQSWRFKAEDPALRHVGPVAEDFAAAFPLGQSDKQITMSDEQGVALAAIQALYQIVREQTAAWTQRDADKDVTIAAQAARISDLEQQVETLKAEQSTYQQSVEARLAALEQRDGR
jgi:hypothetical protein